MTTSSYLGLGANLGSRSSTIGNALAMLSRHELIRNIDKCDVASLYQTSPVGGPPGQRDYFNTCVRIETSASPHDLLAILARIENQLGRVRNEKWSARTIDIDILMMGVFVLSDPDLTLPHPHMHERRFVLEPLAEIAGPVVHPVLKLTIDELLDQIRISSNEVVRRVDDVPTNRPFSGSGLDEDTRDLPNEAEHPAQLTK